MDGWGPEKQVWGKILTKGQEERSKAEEQDILGVKLEKETGIEDDA